MKKYSLGKFLGSVLICYAFIYIIAITIIRVTNETILKIKFSLIPAVADYQVYWLWKFNLIVSILIPFIYIIFRFRYIWLYFVVEKFIFLFYINLQLCTGEKCVSCGYLGSSPSNLRFDYFIGLNILFILVSIILFFKKPVFCRWKSKTAN